MGNILNLKQSSYASAKIAIKKRSLYGNEKIKKLVEYEFDEILRYLEEHGFRKSVDKAYLQYQGFYLVERILNDHLSDIYKSVFAGATGNNKKLLEAYYLKYQIHNLMALLRCKISKEDDFEAYLIGDANSKEKFIKAWDMPADDGITYICKKLGFMPSKVLDNSKKGIYDVENYLYRVYYDRLKSITFKYNNREERVFTKFISEYIDLLNARSYLRIKNEPEGKIQFEDFYLEGGNLLQQKFEDLNSKSMENTLVELKNILKKEEFSLDTLSIATIDKSISSHKKNAHNVFSKSRFGSPFYSLKFLFETEKEMRQLRILLKAKYLKVEKEEIMRLII